MGLQQGSETATRVVQLAKVVSRKLQKGGALPEIACSCGVEGPETFIWVLTLYGHHATSRISLRFMGPDD